MPKLPVLSGREVVAALERLGFVQMRQRGSHVILQREGVGVVVPLHRELKTGTLAGVIRQAGLSQDEFLKAVR
ncbi:type II toxin-antitoxin system HicA family toxin [Sphingopyxis indica]|uniref:Predicted RNA binding protein YcfA, dsRBD-like fold, HicA-like mRNA interferase family n=1 Tax=Sphingopyxis indica TaxID=436663 RepID=A0A239L4M6_9SPHN|nr:type II toxin-antitoxin system HicA family toxin [Sphingopyxis indica]WOF42617.1 type II toxin-antitoxin system HicA family toxin [Sphingopyxis indica]SNT25275.1 Predicted RNA binding protein YcfA, dsRBD-like fold, HicA-like mRNA interferase family [Sphingopyxis indica]